MLHAEPCRNFARYKGVFEPRCHCMPCWRTFFHARPGESLAGKAALEQLGEKKVIAVKGTRFLQALTQFLAEEGLLASASAN